MGANKQLIDFITAENELDGQEVVYIAQGGKTRKTSLEKIKKFTSKEKIELFIGEDLPEINERNEKTLYLKVTDTINSSSNGPIKASPTMGLKEV